MLKDIILYTYFGIIGICVLIEVLKYIAPINSKFFKFLDKHFSDEGIDPY